MNTIPLAVSLYLFVVFGNRLRQISWCTTRPIFVSLYLSNMLWALSLVYEASIGAFDWHDAMGALAMAVMSFITSPNWADGPPESFANGIENLRQPDL